MHNSLNAACGEYPSVFYLGFAPHHHTPLEMGRSCGTDRPGEGAREGNGGLSPTAVDRLRAGRPLAADKNNYLCACARSARPMRFSRAARFISACPAIGSVPVIRPPSARARLRRSVPRFRLSPERPRSKSEISVPAQALPAGRSLRPPPHRFASSSWRRAPPAFAGVCSGFYRSLVHWQRHSVVCERPCDGARW